MSLLALFSIRASAQIAGERCGSVGACNPALTCYNFEPNGYPAVSPTTGICVSDVLVGEGLVCSADRTALDRALTTIPEYNALCESKFSCYYPVITPEASAAVCMNLTVVCNGPNGCDTVEGSPEGGLCVSLDDTTGVYTLVVEEEEPGVCIPPGTVPLGEVCSIDQAGSSPTFTVSPNRMCEGNGTCVGHKEGEPAICRAAACVSGDCTDIGSKCMKHDVNGFATESTADGYCIPNASVGLNYGDTCTVVVESATDTDIYIATCADAANTLACVVPETYPSSGTCQVGEYTKVTCPTGTCTENGATCKAVLEGVGMTTTATVGVCLVDATDAGEACSTALADAASVINEDTMIRACPAVAPVCAVVEDGLFATTKQAECTSPKPRVECQFEGGVPCASGEICVLFETNGYSYAVDAQRPSGFCVSSLPVVDGAACSAFTVSTRATGSDLPIEYNALCSPGSFCYYDMTNKDTTTFPAVCMPLTTCESQDVCDDTTSISLPLTSNCVQFDEQGIASEVVTPPNVFTVRGAVKAAAGATCIPEMPVSTGAACSIDDASATLDVQINRICDEGGACSGYLEGLPATCRAPTGPACKGGDSTCAAPSLCGNYGAEDGIFVVADVGTDGICLALVDYGEKCTIELRSAADLPRDNYSGACADTLACKIPATLELAPINILCELADYTAPTPCTFGGTECDSNASTSCLVYGADKLFTAVATGVTGAVCLAPAVIGTACSAVIEDITGGIPTDKLIRSCPYMCDFSILHSITKQAECLNEDGTSIIPTMAPSTTTTTTTVDPNATTAAPTVKPTAAPQECSKCEEGEYCTDAQGDLVDSSGYCLPGAYPGQLCADSMGDRVAFCLSTDGCIDTGIWWTCAGEYQASAVSTFTTAAVALLAVSFLF